MAGGADNPAQMRGLRPFAGQLSAVALGRGPLVSEDVGRGRFAIGCQKVDEAQCEECALTQTDFGRCRRFVGNPLQKHGMGQADGPGWVLIRHQAPHLQHTCLTAR